MEFLHTNIYIHPLLLCLLVGTICWTIMARTEKKFFTVGRVKQSFSILDLQFSPSEQDFNKLLSGIQKLPASEAKSSRKALKKHLYIDFLFMPALYLFILFLCFITAGFMRSSGVGLFKFLGYLQILPWACDIAENWFILKRMQVISEDHQTFNFYRILVFVKWGVAAVVLVAALSVLVYFWMGGRL